MNFKKKIIKILRPNYDYVFGFLIFISYRYFFTWLLWHGRGVPPVSDNAYFYLSSANNIFNLQNFEQFRLVIFSAFLSTLGLFTGGNLETAFKINFFVGPIIMFFALAFFLKKLEANKNIRLLLFLIMALYSGSGAYHGFYWVVPSFYQLALFFVILGFLVSKTKVNTLVICVSSFLFIFIHPTSIFVSGIFFAYFFMKLILRRVNNVLKNNFKWIAISLAGSFALYYLIGRAFPSAGSPESFQVGAQLLRSFFTGQAKPISLPVIWREYFAIFFVNPLSTVAYFVMFYLVFYARQTKILILFVSAALLVAAGAYIPYGSRTLGYLWPLTFICITYSLVGVFNLLKKFDILKYLTVLPLILLITIATIFNLISTITLNFTKDYSWDRSCPGKLTGNKTFFTSLESLYAFNLYGLSQSDAVFLSEDRLPQVLKNGTFFVQTIDTPKFTSTLSTLWESFAQKITRRKEPVKVQFPQNSWTLKPASSLGAKLNQNGLVASQIYDCGKFVVYRVNKI